MPGGTQKYEREIAEILERLDNPEPRAPLSHVAPSTTGGTDDTPRRRARPDLGFARFGRYAATWRWISLTLAAGILGAALRQYSPVFGVIFGLLMVLMFFSPLLGLMRHAPQRTTARVWRGQVIDLPPRGGIVSQLDYRWRRFRRSRR